MPTNTSLMCSNHYLTTLTPLQKLSYFSIQSGPTNATLAPFNYTQFGTFRPTFHIKTGPKRVGRKRNWAEKWPNLRHSAELKTHNTALDIFRAISHILVLLSFTIKRLFYTWILQNHIANNCKTKKRINLFYVD